MVPPSTRSVFLSFFTLKINKYFIGTKSHDVESCFTKSSLDEAIKFVVIIQSHAINAEAITQQQEKNELFKCASIYDYGG